MYIPVIQRVAYIVLYYPIQRYKFESNSQPLLWRATSIACCIIRYKDTNLKAIHNRIIGVSPAVLLYYPIQRYKFESNSQPQLANGIVEDCCIIRYKDTNLKAIHNLWAWKSSSHHVVLSDTKIQIWKQFTTGKWHVKSKH